MLFKAIKPPQLLLLLQSLQQLQLQRLWQVAAWQGRPAMQAAQEPGRRDLQPQGPGLAQAPKHLPLHRQQHQPVPVEVSASIAMVAPPCQVLSV